jgi:hypothetical protein
LKPRSANPKELFELPLPLLLLLLPKNMNIEIPMLTSRTTTYLYGLNLRR